MATEFDDYSDEDVDAIPQAAHLVAPALSKASSVKAYHHETTIRAPDSFEAAPVVSTFGLDTVVVDLDKKLVTNPKIDALRHPLQGPVDPAKSGGLSLEGKRKNMHMGHLESTHLSEFDFQDAMLSHDKFKSASAKSFFASGGSAPSQNKFLNQGIWGESALTGGKRLRGQLQEGGRKRIRNDDAADTDNFQGPWAAFEGEGDRRKFWENQMSEIKADQERVTEEEAIAKGQAKDLVKVAETSRFYGKTEYDYQGRSWMTFKQAHQDKRDFQQMLEDEETWTYLPKKQVHTYTGHTQGVQTVRLFPETGHLLLSAGLDAKVKIWDFYNQRQCLRDYMGHDVGVRDVRFTTDGSRFYSCSFDKNINLWDTETGKIITTMTNNKTPFCIAVHPDPSKQNSFIAGCSNKKAVEWDANTGKIVQEYDEHLGSVNSITFCENGKKLVTTADDKKMLIWEYGIPIPTKYITDPLMHSIPTVAVSPDKKTLLGQSMDNKIVTYQAYGQFKYQARKSFKGHASSGYACEISWSPDGQFITSGDGNGKLWFWGWRNNRVYKSMNAHSGALMSCCWHPKHTSRVITCGYDGLIKVWD
ncbi:unnamed protein product [Amoebophrya sp. A120]|nr:unnamed protein product [Amoebophrya sp. A120]|eukprot:GSA120T00002225001.1